MYICSSKLETLCVLHEAVGVSFDLRSSYVLHSIDLSKLCRRDTINLNYLRINVFYSVWNSLLFAWSCRSQFWCSFIFLWHPIDLSKVCQRDTVDQWRVKTSLKFGYKGNVQLKWMDRSVFKSLLHSFMQYFSNMQYFLQFCKTCKHAKHAKNTNMKFSCNIFCERDTID